MAIRFERTRDYNLVASIMTNPALYPWLADDFYPAPEHFRPMESDAIFYLLAWDDPETPNHANRLAFARAPELLGLYITHAINPLLWEVHHALLPWAWGKRALEVGRAYEAWMWENTHARKLIGFTPACNRLAIRYAKRLGMTEAGRITRCYQRQFETHDLVIFEKART